MIRIPFGCLPPWPKWWSWIECSNTRLKFEKRQTQHDMEENKQYSISYNKNKPSRTPPAQHSSVGRILTSHQHSKAKSFTFILWNGCFKWWRSSFDKNKRVRRVRMNVDPDGDEVKCKCSGNSNLIFIKIFEI